MAGVVLAEEVVNILEEFILKVVLLDNTSTNIGSRASVVRVFGEEK